MPKLRWQVSYSVGEEELDNQHKVLFRLINGLHDSADNALTTAEIISELDNYVQKHFRYEEGLMRAAHYQDLEAHLVEHRHFESWLNSMRTFCAIEGVSSQSVAEAIAAYLVEWLYSHILVVDMSYRGKLNQ